MVDLKSQVENLLDVIKLSHTRDGTERVVAVLPREEQMARQRQAVAGVLGLVQLAMAG